MESGGGALIKYVIISNYINDVLMTDERSSPCRVVDGDGLAFFTVLIAA